MQRSAVLLGSIIGFGVLYLLASLTLGPTPGPHDAGSAVASWFVRHGGHVRLWLWLLTLALPLLGVFGSLMRSELPDVYGDIFFIGIAAFLVELAVQGWIWAGLAWHPSDLTAPTARTLLDIANYWGPVLNSATLLTLAPITVLGLSDRRRVPRWVGCLAGTAMVEQMLETITIFGRNGFIAPGGPMNLYLGAGLVAASWISLAIGTTRSMAQRRSQTSR